MRVEGAEGDGRIDTSQPTHETINGRGGKSGTANKSAVRTEPEEERGKEVKSVSFSTGRLFSYEEKKKHQHSLVNKCLMRVGSLPCDTETVRGDVLMSAVVGASSSSSTVPWCVC